MSLTLFLSSDTSDGDGQTLVALPLQATVPSESAAPCGMDSKITRMIAICIYRCRCG